MKNQKRIRVLKRVQLAQPIQRNAFLLLAVLLVISAITLSAVAFTQSMFVGHEESVLAGEYIQARYAADSGLDAARLFLAASRTERDEAGGTYDNPNYFQAIPVLTGRDPLNVCNYTLVAPSLDENGSYTSARFGLQNENARLNLNVLPLIDSQFSVAGLMQQATGAAGVMAMAGGSGSGGAGIAGGLSTAGTMSASGGGGGGGASGASSGGVGRTFLMALPGMTEDIADAILDFIDEDDNSREYGAERDYYAQLPVPYAPINGPLQSIEQLLLVRGVTPELLFGMDQNRNGVLDGSEQAMAQSATSMSTTGTSPTLSADGTQLSQLGWSIFLTLYSKEKNVASDGTPRININGPDLTTLQSDLAAAVGDDLATFIIAYRMNGAGSANGGGGGAGGAPGGQGGGGAGGAPGGGGFPGGGGGMGGGPGGNRGNDRRGQGGNGGGPGAGGPGRGGPGGGGPGGGGPGGGGPGGGGPGGGGPGAGGPGRVGPGGGGPGGGGPGGGGPGAGGPGRGGPGGGGGPGGQGQGGPRSTRGRSNFDLSVLSFHPTSLVSFLQRGGPRSQQAGGGPGGGGPGGAGPGGQRGPGQPNNGGNGGGVGGPRNGPPGQGGGGPGGPGGPGNGRGDGPNGRGGDRQGRGPGQDGNGPGGGGRDGRGGGNDRGGRGGGGMGGGGMVGGVGMSGGGQSGGQAGGNARTEKWTAAAFPGLNIDASQGSGSQVRQVLDLIGAQFTATVNGEQITYVSPLDASPIAMAVYLPTIMDKLTAVDATVLPGRININEAPREILAGLPGMTSEILEALIQSRSQSADNSNRKFETWPMVEGILTLQQMQLIAPLVTGGGDVMRAQSVGYFEKSAGFARTEAVIDAAGQVPIVVLYRKMDHLGRGFSQATLGQRAQGLVVTQ
jgi:DNA uptake protein ComE-like DNA-binding protein